MVFGGNTFKSGLENPNSKNLLGQENFGLGQPNIEDVTEGVDLPNQGLLDSILGQQGATFANDIFGGVNQGARFGSLFGPKGAAIGGIAGGLIKGLNKIF